MVWLASLIAWWIYAGDRDQLVPYLRQVGIIEHPERVADFSIHQAGWFVVVFLATALLTMAFCGALAGRRAVWGGAGLVLLLVADLGLANQPWIVYWNYHEKYASDLITDRLRLDPPYAHRVALCPNNSPNNLQLSKMYKVVWQQQLFPFYNIESCEVVEMSRMPEDFGAFIALVNDATRTNAWLRLARVWQLSSSRYVIAPVAFAGYLPLQPECASDQLQALERFRFDPKPGFTRATDANQLAPVADSKGPFALFDFAPALPRAGLFYHWDVRTNEAAVLAGLFDPAFDPARCVGVTGDQPPNPAGDVVGAAPGPVEIVSYAPKDMVLRANAAAPAILMLTDHYAPDWKVWVDGRPETVLRCDFLLRGVRLTPGAHQIEFRFQPPTTWPLCLAWRR